MKFYFKIVILFLLFSACSGTEDCIKSSGNLTSKEVEVPEFNKIIVYNGIALVITQGENYKVEVKTGSNLIDDISVNVSNEMLVLKDNTACNWVRDYGKTVVYVTTPNLTEVYSKTEKTISSIGILKFPSLKLFSMDQFDTYEGTGTGDFILNIDNENLVIETNNIAHFTLTGKTNSFYIGVYEGNGVVDAKNLLANEINFYHRGSNTIFVNPINFLKGNLYNLGNVILVNKPTIVTVSEYYKGKLIYQ